MLESKASGKHRLRIFPQESHSEESKDSRQTDKGPFRPLNPERVSLPKRQWRGAKCGSYVDRDSLDEINLLGQDEMH